MSLLVFLALFLPVILGGTSILAFRINQNVLKLLLAFSGAFLLAISFLDLIPEIYAEPHETYVGIFILLGFLVQVLLDFFTKGVEHGHEDHHHHMHAHHINLLPILAGICIHSFLEGMPLAENFSNHKLQHTLLTGIVIHNLPISIVLMSLLINSGATRTRALTLLAIFALSAPAGTLVSNYLDTGLLAGSDLFFKLAMAMVVGIFLHISTTIIFESEEDHRFNFLKLAMVLLGFLIVSLI